MRLSYFSHLDNHDNFQDDLVFADYAAEYNLLACDANDGPKNIIHGSSWCQPGLYRMQQYPSIHLHANSDHHWQPVFQGRESEFGTVRIAQLDPCWNHFERKGLIQVHEQELV